MEEQPITTKKSWYDKNYKIILIAPAIILIISVVYLFQFVNLNGDIIIKDVSLTGGTTITVFDQDVKISDLKTALNSQFPDSIIRSISDIRTGEQQAFSVETVAKVEEIKPALENFLSYELNSENSSTEFSEASLSQGFYEQLRIAVLIAFLFMSCIVFIIFRTPIPSLAVIIAAFADIVMTITVINLLGLTVSSAGIVAILMLIGYSVDTDILLTSRVIRRREGTINDRLKGAFKTGLTMTLTAIGAILIALIIIYSFSATLKQMFTILLIGLSFDIFNTWITNASILKWYAEAKNL